MENNNVETAATASTEDVAACTAQVDVQVKTVLGRVLAQRSAGTAFGYGTALSPGTRANCWSIAEAAGHEGAHRMQALLGSYAWDWKDLREQLPALAAAWLPGREEDLIGPGIAIDETAQLKHGDATACVAPQHAGCTGQVENCVTTVFSTYVTTSGQACADFDVSMPDRWARDPERRRAAVHVLPVLRPGGQASDHAVLHRHRRAQVASRRNVQNGKDVLGWDQCQARGWDAACRHTALSALAQLRQAAIRNALCSLIRLTPAGDTGAPAPAAATQTLTSMTLTCAYPSTTRPSRPTPDSPARAGPA